METVAVLGAGLLGSGFVEAARGRGIAVRVYNRTRDKAEALRAFGAEVAGDPASAVAGVDRVHVVLSDDAAVDAVLEQAGDALRGVPVVDHTTVSPAGVVARVARLRARGVAYVHAPVFMAPANARAATGMMLVCGAPEAVDPLVPALEAMTGRLMRLGERVDLAAAMKLFGNAVLIQLVAAAGDVLAMARSLGVPPEQALALFDVFDPAPGLRGRGGRIAREEWEPASFELVMARRTCGSCWRPPAASASWGCRRSRRGSTSSSPRGTARRTWPRSGGSADGAARETRPTVRGRGSPRSKLRRMHRLDRGSGFAAPPVGRHSACLLAQHVGERAGARPPTPARRARASAGAEAWSRL
ncbi:MAG: NAD(P)-binding domain-containing protein [Myxococcota bacterium]